jgi:hypothetical protein
MKKTFLYSSLAIFLFSFSSNGFSAPQYTDYQIDRFCDGIGIYSFLGWSDGNFERTGNGEKYYGKHMRKFEKYKQEHTTLYNIIKKQYDRGFESGKKNIEISQEDEKRYVRECKEILRQQ